MMYKKVPALSQKLSCFHTIKNSILLYFTVRLLLLCFYEKNVPVWNIWMSSWKNKLLFVDPILSFRISSLFLSHFISCEIFIALHKKKIPFTCEILHNSFSGSWFCYFFILLIKKLNVFFWKKLSQSLIFIIKSNKVFQGFYTTYIFFLYRFQNQRKWILFSMQ